MEKLFAELLRSFQANEIDARRDDLAAIHRKQDAVSRALQAFGKQAKALLFVRRHLGLDYARFADATFPRLTGRVVRVGPGANFPDFAAAERDLRDGDVVLIGEGVFQLPRSREWRDTLLVGMGSERTTLRGQIDVAQRVQLTAMQIDCQNTEFLDLRRGGAVRVQKCAITNYNSGAGGSNAIFGRGVTLLIEDCTFDGLPGRRGKSGTGGDAFDLRENNFLYVRNTEFIDNKEIVRARALCVFDRCRSRSPNVSESGISIYDDGYVLTRETTCKVRGEADAFSMATDDLEVVRFLMDRKAELDRPTKDAVRALGLRDNPRYWATLLHHPDKEVRFIAQGRLGALLRGLLPKYRPSKEQLAQVPKEMRKPFDAALRSSHALRWLDANHQQLRWDAKRRRFVFRQ